MKTPPAFSASVVVLVLTLVALAGGTIYLLPVALMFYPFLPLLGVVMLLALARPGDARVLDSRVAGLDPARQAWSGMADHNVPFHDLML